MSDDTGSLIGGTGGVVADGGDNSGVGVSAPAGADQQDASFIVGADGSFSSGWREHLPEDLRAEPSLQDFKSLSAMAKSLVNAQKLIGRDKVPMPNDHSTPEEWGNFFNRIGRPESPDGYKFDDPKLPEGVQPNTELEGGFRQKAHELGLSGKQAADLFSWYNQTAAEQLGKQQQDAALTIEQADAELRSQWGRAYDQNLELARRAAKTYDAGGLIDELGLGNDPRVLGLFAKIGKSISEDRLSTIDRPLAPIDAQTQINDIMGTANHPYFNPNHPGHADAVKKMAVLFAQAHP